tara:strand:+ start:639 stop:863 length:225 start_codon:yes stop_codon:yes gene_type:complete
MRTNLLIIRDEITKNIKAILINDKYEYRGNDKLYDVRYANKELTDYPDWLKNSEIQKMLKDMWLTLTPKQNEKT